MALRRALRTGNGTAALEKAAAPEAIVRHEVATSPLRLFAMTGFSEFMLSAVFRVAASTFLCVLCVLCGRLF
jgi:hypothetical protein